MQSFILTRNIENFTVVLEREDLSVGEAAYVRRQLAAMRKELALIEAADLGSRCGPIEIGSLSARESATLRSLVETSDHPCIVLNTRTGLHITEANDAYTAATLTPASAMLGQRMFDVFPENPDLPEPDGVVNLFGSVRAAVQTGVAQVMPVQRWDVRDASGVFVPRYWRCTNTPVFNEHRQVALVLHRAEDITAQFMPA